ncbi:MAG: sigma-54-dependent Fis family transcriptional regulator [Deferribacteres bacterium]|nr:sigma-54-dependent Fis family transcriptional regulator [candidate division KSB1 bacterium]MCB9500870.1 sigma-54-dependent Fis family transcriptional regulator [Deferribacteres bacterium]
MYSILAVDDDTHFLDIVSGLLQHRKYRVETSNNPTAAIELIDRNNYDCILLDVKMPGIDGISLLDQIIRLKPHVPVIMISGQSSLAIAVKAIKIGAYDFLEKGVETDRLLVTVQNAIAKKSWQEEKHTLLDELQKQFQMIGESEGMQSIFHQIKTIAPTDAKVLIYGETGTGKELVARAIHFNSNRAGKPYIKVNCAAIPETLIESIFFGHVKGSFSGAYMHQTGKFELAHNGTLFLDEIAELNLQAQAKLLRVLQDGEIEKIGATQIQTVDVRIIAATNQNLAGRVANGTFREDLFHRLRVIELEIPPLRARQLDIPLLADFFRMRFSEKYNKRITGFSPQAMNLIMSEKWPGNVRALENLIEKAVIFTKALTIDQETIFTALYSDARDDQLRSQTGSLKEFLEQNEKEFIEKNLVLAKGKKQIAAEMMEIDRATLWKKMRKYKLDNS